jgi:antitoxin ParD1/3/4
MPSSYAIGSHFENLIKQKIESGRYSSASEVVRDALRLFEEVEELRAERLKALRQKIQEGRDSGPDIPADEVFSRLEAKYGNLSSEASR